MKALVAFSTSLLLLGAVALSPTASADTAEATCEVRKDGEAKAGQSGACTFSQRQGYVDISLRNGESWSLTPGDAANQYRDQKGNKVVRTVEGQDHVYKWPNRKITVRFGGGQKSTSSSTSGGVSDLQDMVDGRWVGAEVADEMARRGYKSVRDSVAGGYVTSHYQGHGKCVIVNLDTDKKVTSIDEGPGC
jgi:hypothetical protein